MRSPLAAAAAALCLVVAQAAAAQSTTTFTSLAGPWWFTIGGKDKGAMVIEFGPPGAGAFLVQDITLNGKPSFGFSSALGAFFRISAGQELQFDSNGNIVGDLELSDPIGGGPVGTLSILKGKPDQTFTILKLRATIDGVVVKLKGVRPPAAYPVLTGRTTSGSVSGKGVKSKAMDLAVHNDLDLGLPAYAWTGEGPVEIDKVQTPGVTVAGHVVLTPGFKVFGLLEDSSHFATGLVSGKLKIPDPNTPIPKLGLNAQSTPKLKLKGTLTEAVEPILSVTPLSFDFGALHLGATATTVFHVANVGTPELLTGSVAFVSNTPDFDLTGDTTFTLDPNDPNTANAEIEVSFDPSSAGAKSAQLRFAIDGGVGAQVVSVSGTGGAGEIQVDPNPVLFGSLSITATTPTFMTVTVTNAGDGTLTGQATLAAGTAFKLATTDTDIAQPSISYTIDPGKNAAFRIRFLPSAPAGLVNDTLSLTGAGSGVVTVPVSGTGTSP